MNYERAERITELAAMGATELARMVIRLEQDVDAHRMSKILQVARKTNRRISLMPYYPQFDPDRPTTPAEDFNDLNQEAMERFIAWLTEEPDTLEHIIDTYRDTRAVQTAVQAWSEEVKAERR